MKQQINLYQGEYRLQRPIFSGAGLVATWAALACVLVLAQSLTNRHMLGVIAELDYTRQREARVLEQMQELTGALRRDDTENGGALDAAVRQLAEKEQLLGMLQRDEIGASNGFSGHMRAFARRVLDGLWLTRVVISAPGGQTMLEGEARIPELIPTYLQGLAHEPALSGQRFAQFTIERAEDDTGSAVSFHMTSEASARVAGAGVEP